LKERETRVRQDRWTERNIEIERVTERERERMRERERNEERKIEMTSLLKECGKTQNQMLLTKILNFFKVLFQLFI